MGEEHKEEEKKEEEAKEEKKEEEETPEIVFKVDMHCEACARKVARALKGFEGVEEVKADSKASKVVVKGKKADPMKVYERLQKKSGRKVELISPLPVSQPPEEQKEEKKEPPEPEQKKEEPPPVVTVVLKVGMHCEACAQVIQKRIRKIKGVESVETDVGNDKVIVKGVIEGDKLVDYVYKRTRKQASIVKDKEEEKKKETEEEEKKKGEENNKAEKEKEEGGENENDEKGEGEISMMKRYEYWPSKDYVDYVYAPQFFSDDNPNACSLM